MRAGILRTVRVRSTNVLVLLTAPAFLPAIAPFLPNWHWSLDLAACWPVQAAAALAAAAALLALARRFRLACTWLGGAVLGGAAVVPGWLAAPNAKTDGLPLRVLCMNLLRGNERDVAAAVHAVQAHAPDVLFCCEMTPAWLAALRPALAAFPHRIEHADAGYFGVALYSRLPLASAEVMPLGFAWAPAIRAVVTTAAGPLGLLGVHTPRPGMGERCRERDAALAAIPAALLPLPATRIVLGDCNATPWNRAFRDLLAATGLAHGNGGAFLPTWPMQLPWPLRTPIDHVLISPDVGVEAIATDPAFGSDHAPLFAALRLPTAANAGSGGR